MIVGCRSLTWSYMPRQSRSSKVDLFNFLTSKSALLASVGATSHRFHRNPPVPPPPPPPPLSAKRNRNGDCDCDDDAEAAASAAIAANAARR